MNAGAHPSHHSALAAPDVAWPTVLVALAAWTAQAVAFWAAWTGRWPPAAVVAVASVAAYFSFTALHESVHGSLCLRARVVNGIVARLAAVPLMAPGWAYRFIHLEHHRHTNDVEKDPDFWNGAGPRWALPLRWATADWAQYLFYFRRGSERPRAEVVEALLVLAGFSAAAALGFVTGHGRAVLLAWVLPARIAVFVLSYAFDYILHRPHRVTSDEDRFAATNNVDLPLPLRLLMVGQDLHLVHHLHPGLPFYRYGAAWEALGRPQARSS
ncbi:MAG TPA: fatty acid desaturase [Myxococcales bacterium]|jgi:fatty acid desaturase|nr:fatty acid desaturase [Myxococcales bacterium]